MDFSDGDYLQLITEMDYLEYKIQTIDVNDLTKAKELNILYERYEYLEELLNTWRAMQFRKGFKLIMGGKVER